jgi:hypothetical protein
MIDYVHCTCAVTNDFYSYIYCRGILIHTLLPCTGTFSYSALCGSVLSPRGKKGMKGQCQEIVYAIPSL